MSDIEKKELDKLADNNFETETSQTPSAETDIFKTKLSIIKNKFLTQDGTAQTGTSQVSNTQTTTTQSVTPTVKNVLGAKRGRGRPKGSTKKATTQTTQTGTAQTQSAGATGIEEIDEIASLVGDMPADEFLTFIFEMIAKRRGAHWLLDEDEAKFGGKIADKLIKKYVPLTLPYLLEIIGAGYFIMLLWRRFSVDRENPKKKNEKQEAS